MQTLSGRTVTCPDCGNPVIVPRVQIIVGQDPIGFQAGCSSCGWTDIDEAYRTKRGLLIFGGQPPFIDEDEVGVTRKRIAVDQTFTSATLADITELVTGGLINAFYYHFEFSLIVRTTSALEGAKIGLVFPSGNCACTVTALFAADGAAASWSGAITTSGDSVTTTDLPVANTDYLISMIGNIHPTANGILEPQAATESGTSTLTVRAGSSLILTQIP